MQNKYFINRKIALCDLTHLQLVQDPMRLTSWSVIVLIESAKILTAKYLCFSCFTWPVIVVNASNHLLSFHQLVIPYLLMNRLKWKSLPRQETSQCRKYCIIGVINKIWRPTWGVILYWLVYFILLMRNAVLLGTVAQWLDNWTNNHKFIMFMGCRPW